MIAYSSVVWHRRLERSLTRRRIPERARDKEENVLTMFRVKLWRKQFLDGDERQDYLSVLSSKSRLPLNVEMMDQGGISAVFCQEQESSCRSIRSYSVIIGISPSTAPWRLPWPTCPGKKTLGLPGVPGSLRGLSLHHIYINSVQGGILVKAPTLPSVPFVVCGPSTAPVKLGPLVFCTEHGRHRQAMRRSAKLLLGHISPLPNAGHAINMLTAINSGVRVADTRFGHCIKGVFIYLLF